MRLSEKLERETRPGSPSQRIRSRAGPLPQLYSHRLKVYSPRANWSAPRQVASKGKPAKNQTAAKTSARQQTTRTKTPRELAPGTAWPQACSARRRQQRCRRCRRREPFNQRWLAKRIDHLRRTPKRSTDVAEPGPCTATKGVQRSLLGDNKAVLTANCRAARPDPRKRFHAKRQ